MNLKNNLEIFKNGEFGEIRTLNDDGKIMFCGNDVATALGYAKPHNAIATHCKGVTLKQGNDKSGRLQQMSFITEGDLYRLITHSKLQSAEKFEKWVFDEVLPTIRKHGMYATDELLNNPDFAIQVLTQLKTEREEKARLQLVVEEQKPKVLFANAVETAHTSILIGDLAKLIKQNGYDIGQNRLFKWLRENGYLIKNGERRNMPTQSSMDKELFEVKERTINDPNGIVRITKTVKVTGKGQIYFINKFCEKNINFPINYTNDMVY